MGLVRSIDQHFIPASRRRMVISEARTVALFYAAGFVSCTVLVLVAFAVYWIFN